VYVEKYGKTAFVEINLASTTAKAFCSFVTFRRIYVYYAIAYATYFNDSNWRNKLYLQILHITQHLINNTERENIDCFC